MVACCFLCHVAVAVVEMSCSSPATRISSSSASVASQFCPSKPSQFSGGTTKLYGFGFELQRKKNWLKRRLKFVVNAELSKAFSIGFGLDSQVKCSHCHSSRFSFFLDIFNFLFIELVFFFFFFVVMGV
jgi:hypothetical protein